VRRARTAGSAGSAGSEEHGTRNDTAATGLHRFSRNSCPMSSARGVPHDLRQ
jgi:hypothetical protein